jgi:hypothetical protein
VSDVNHNGAAGWQIHKRPQERAKHHLLLDRTVYS